MTTPDINTISDHLRTVMGWILEQPSIPEEILVAMDRVNQKIPALHEMKEKAEKYDAINTPELKDFWGGAQNEALHQRERWGVTGNDVGKTDADWFWLIGYLSGKALHNPPRDDMSPRDLRLHRIITIAAAAANWHGHLTGNYGDMRPGTATVERFDTGTERRLQLRGILAEVERLQRSLGIVRNDPAIIMDSLVKRLHELTDRTYKEGE